MKATKKSLITSSVVLCLVLAVIAALLLIPKVSAHYEGPETNEAIITELRSVDEEEKANIIANSIKDMQNEHALLVAEMAAEKAAAEEAARIEAQQQAAAQVQQQPETYSAPIWEAPQEYYYVEPVYEAPVQLPSEGLPDWATGVQSMGSYDSFIPY